MSEIIHLSVPGMSDADRYRRLWKLSVVAVLLGVPMMVVNWSELFGLGRVLPPMNTIEGKSIGFFLGLISLLLMAYTGGHIYRSAWTSLRRFELNQDSLSALGTVIAWAYSMALVALPLALPSLHLYFDTAILVIALNNIGLLLEMRLGAEGANGIQPLSSQPANAQLAAGMARVLVPSVLIIAVLSFLAWYRFTPAGGNLQLALSTIMSVLFIASPAALALVASFPLALGIGKAEALGARIHNAAVLPWMGKLTTVVLDKTATVTEGRPRVVEVIPADGFSEEEVLRYALSAESSSQHLLARAIVEYARSKGHKKKLVSAYQLVPGQGIEAVVEGEVVRVGNTRLMMEKGIDGGWLGRKAAELSQLAQTPVFISVGKEIAGLISVRDAVKPDSAAAIARMKQAGRKVILLSGDNVITCDVIAKQLGVDEVIADVLPVEKLAELEQLQKQGEVVAMVGVANSDAEILACADVAIDLGGEVTDKGVDITLTQGSLHGVMNAIEVSGSTLANIKLGLFVALLYNSLTIPLAAGILFPFLGNAGVIPPIIAAVAMLLSRLLVVANARRLQRYTVQQR